MNNPFIMIQSPLRRRLRIPFAAALFQLAGLGAADCAYTDPSIDLRTVSTATNANQPIVVLQPATGTTVTLVATPGNFTPTSYSWSQVPATLNSFATTGTATFSATQTSVPQVGVTLPATGIYQFRVVATDGASTVSRYTWVNVWDRVSALNPLQLVGKNPDIAPPTSVRQLSLDPGPYCHPRLLFSRRDWPELSGKAVTSNEVTTAVNSLKTRLSNHFDKPGDALNNYASVLRTYANGGYDPACYNNTVLPAYAAAGGAISGSLLGKNPDGSFYDALETACYLAWIGTDPTLPHASVPAAAQARFNDLAMLVAAASKVELTRNAGANPFYNLAISYDLIYDWMTAAQQADARDHLYAIGYGWYNGGGGGIQKTPPIIQGGRSQNGDFPNLADSIILPALVIEGEEASVTAAVQSTYGPTAAYATGASAWPYASPASVSNLYRQSRWNTDWLVTPWGSMLNATDYFELSMTYAAPGTLALARRGQNQFVTTHFYQSSLGCFYSLAPRESDGKMVLYDHHDGLGYGNGSSTNNGRYIIKYMYPDDPMVDYVYRSFRAEGGNELAQAIFGSQPSALNLSNVAQAKNLSLTKLDPLRGCTTTRNGWAENDLAVYFESRGDVEGHMHAEANNFSLYALGRAWSSPPGYHCTINDLAATVLIQKPALAADPATQGYIGESPSSATTSPTNGNFPTPPGKLLEVTEDPGKQWTLFAGDASAAYNYGFVPGSSQKIDTGKKPADFFYDGVLRHLLPQYQTDFTTSHLVVNDDAFNPVEYALRTLFTVRGSQPYVLVIDDITVDGVNPRNYRWSMPCAVSFGGSGGRFVNASNNSVYSSLAIRPGATATDATLYHSPIDDEHSSGQTGLPRLLLRDVTAQSTAGQPAIFLDNRPSGFAGGNLTYGYDNNSKTFTYVPSNRVMIPRVNVVSPAYKVLLFPYLTGENTPVTSWNANKTVLTVDLSNGTVDQITFDSTHADHRTRVSGFSRIKGHAAPTVNLPANLVISADGTSANGQPGGAATFSVTASDYLGNPLTPSLSSPSGTVFPSGINTVQVSAIDSLGQQTTRTFKVTVIPGAPVVSVAAIKNISSSGTDYGITLSWPTLFNTTGYNVKRATQPGGPYTTLSSNQSATTFTDAGLTGTGYHYIVTAMLDSYEGTPCPEIALAPPAGDTLTPGSIGTAVGDGVYKSGDGYVLTASQGDIGAYSEQCTFMSMPWTGDGSFTARLTSVSASPSGASVSQYSAFGVMMRSNTSNNCAFAMSGYNTYVAPIFFKHRDATGALGTGASLFNYSGVAIPVWSRLVRSGSMFSAFYSFDGSTWTPVGTPAAVPVSSTALVGLAVSPQNPVTTTAVFDNLVLLKTPAVSMNASSISLSWAGSLAASYSVQRASQVDGPFVTIASELTASGYTDHPAAGGVYYYTVTASGATAGSTVSPVVSISPSRWLGGAGNWGTGSTANWVSGVDPNGPGQSAWFGMQSAGGQVILDQNRTVGSLSFDNPAGYTLSGAGVLTLQGTGSSADLSNINGNNTLGTAVVLGSNLIANVWNLAEQLTISGTISGAGGLTKLGNGTLVLTGTNSYTGTTTIAAGSLAVTGSLANTAVEVKSGASLGGTGALGGTVTVRSGGHLAHALAATAGAQVAQPITGQLVFESGTLLDLTAVAAPAAGVYTLMTAAKGITGSLPTVNLPAGLTGTVSIDPGSIPNRLLLAVGTGYDIWIAGFTFAPGADLTATGDPDGDGMSNLMEYGLGTLPNSAVSRTTPVLATVANHLTLTFTRSRGDVTYIIEAGSDLSAWSTIATNPGIIGASTTVTDTVDISTADPARRFLRLRVTNP